jgi:hypothetical protein
MGEVRNEHKILVGKPEGQIPLGRPMHTLVDNIRMDLRKMWQESVDWMHVAQDRDQWRAVVNTVTTIRVP